MDTFPKSMTTKQAVIATLAYFDLFGIPLTRAEISEFLLFKEPDNQIIDIYLKESPLIHVYDGFYSLQGDENFYLDFFEKKERTKKFWRHVRRYQWLFSICPFIELVCICNSLPIGDIKNNSDIDVFVVARKGKMFTARLFLTIITHIFRLRRHGLKIEKRFCLSFFVTDDSLNLENITLKPYDIYLAYWFHTMQPISGDYEVYEEMVNINQNWLKKYFHNKIPKNKRFFRRRTKKQIQWKDMFENLLDNEKWETKFEKEQLSRANRKSEKLHNRSGTVINSKMLKFHDTDIRSEIREKWVTRIDSLV